MKNRCFLSKTAVFVKCHANLDIFNGGEPGQRPGGASAPYKRFHRR